MYTRTQKQGSSWNPTSTHKKINGSDGSRSFSVQRQPEINSDQDKEIPSYSRNAADSLITNVMQSMEAREEEAQGHKGQEESGAASVAQAVMPKSELPIAPAASVSQPLGGTGIQRQCSECEQEQQELAMDEGKDFDEMSVGAFAIQTKLTVGAPGDKYEQEADQVAAQVMSKSVALDSSPQVQRFGEEDNPVQMWSLAQSITSVVQRQVDEQVQMRQLVQGAFQAGGNEASFDLESRLNASKGGGSVLAPEVRAFMEPRFGADFSSVRVHTGGEAVQMNRQLGAQAFAHGSDIYYGAGKSPGKDDLTAHELTHTVQQMGGAKEIAQTKTEVIQRFAPAAVAPAVAFGPVGVTVAVGVVRVTIVVLWLNNGGWEEIGRITDAISKGIDGTLEELRTILDQANNAAREQLERIEEYIGTVLMAAPGNQADTGIMNEANELISQGKAEDICEALAILMKEAKAAVDSSRMQRIKGTQKAKGCRHSRHS